MKKKKNMKFGLCAMGFEWPDPAPYLAWPFTILQYDNIKISWDFLRLTVPAARPGHLSAVSLEKSHDIVILSFCNIIKGQANYAEKLVKNGPKYVQIIGPSTTWAQNGRPESNPGQKIVARPIPNYYILIITYIVCIY